MVSTAFLHGAKHNGDSEENKPASLLVVSLDKTLNSMPPFSCGKQVVGPSNLPVAVAKSNRRLATEPERTRNVCASSCIMLRTNSSNDKDV